MKPKYYKFIDNNQTWVIRDRTNRQNEYRIGKNKKNAEKLVNLLNTLTDEIKELKKENEDLIFNLRTEQALHRCLENNEEEYEKYTITPQKNKKNHFNKEIKDLIEADKEFANKKSIHFSSLDELDAYLNDQHRASALKHPKYYKKKNPTNPQKKHI